MGNPNSNPKQSSDSNVDGSPSRNGVGRFFYGVWQHLSVIEKQKDSLPNTKALANQKTPVEQVDATGRQLALSADSKVSMF